MKLASSIENIKAIISKSSAEKLSIFSTQTDFLIGHGKVHNFGWFGKFGQIDCHELLEIRSIRGVLAQCGVVIPGTQLDKGVVKNLE